MIIGLLYSLCKKNFNGVDPADFPKLNLYSTTSFSVDGVKGEKFFLLMYLKIQMMKGTLHNHVFVNVVE